MISEKKILTELDLDILEGRFVFRFLKNPNPRVVGVQEIRVFQSLGKFADPQGEFHRQELDWWSKQTLHLQ